MKKAFSFVDLCITKCEKGKKLYRRQPVIIIVTMATK